MNSLSIKNLVFVFLIVLCTGFSTKEDARRISKDAYFQIEGNVFDSAKIEDALSKIEQAAKINKEEPWVYLSLSLYHLVSGYKSGDWYNTRSFTTGSVEQSLELAEKALQYGTDIAQSHAHYARILIIMKEYKRAWNTLNIAYNQEPDSFYPWYFRGIVAEKMNDKSGIEKYFNEALDRVGHEYQKFLVMQHQIKFAEMSGEYEEVEKLHKLMIAAKPNSAHTHGNYANFLKKQGRFAESINFYKKAISLGPYPLAIKQLEEVKTLANSDE